jgi:hypothetical protein
VNLGLYYNAPRGSNRWANAIAGKLNRTRAAAGIGSAPRRAQPTRPTPLQVGFLSAAPRLDRFHWRPQLQACRWGVAGYTDPTGVQQTLCHQPHHQPPRPPLIFPSTGLRLVGWSWVVGRGGAAFAAWKPATRCETAVATTAAYSNTNCRASGCSRDAQLRPARTTHSVLCSCTLLPGPLLP